MALSVTIFLGSRDPNLIFSLNQCQSDCCLIDPDNVDKFIGALPAFTMDETDAILAYTLNIFRQFPLPNYSFQVEHASGEREDLLSECKEKLEKLFDEQLNYLVSRRIYRELFLHNSIVNIVPASGGFHLEDIKIAKKAPVVVILDDSEESLKALSKIKDAVTIAPLLLAGSLKSRGFIPTIAVTNDPVISENKCKTELLVIDIVSNPKLARTKSQLVWTSSNSDLDLSHLIDGSLEEKVTAYCSEDEFALYVAVELGAKVIYVVGELDEDAEEKFKVDEKSIKLLPVSKFPSQKRRGNEPLLVIDEHNRSLVPKRVLNEVYKAIDSGNGDKDVFRALIWAAEYESVVKLMNGWIDYVTINDVQKDMLVKKQAFLNLVDKTKQTLLSGTNYSQIKYRKLLNTLPHKCIKVDIAFELKALMESNPPFATELSEVRKKDYPKEISVEYAAKYKLDLYVKKSSGVFQYFGHDLEYIEDKYDQKSIVNIVIIPGLMNFELQQFCLELLPGVPIVTMEPNTSHFAQVLNYIPMISIMGRSGIWLNGDVKDLSEAYKNLLQNSDIKALVLDPDPQNLRDDLTVLKKLMSVEGL
ncbi:MAG: hypothetical protein NE328_15405 [Lentisphaeraceae bacterium]|nr:hypothetical protein [Lentisphaeraceae bacterium]